MATWDDVARLALALPGASEGSMHGNRSWAVRDKHFAWERPLRKSDLKALGDAAPAGPILGVRTDGLAAKEAYLQNEPGCCFTTPHFDGYPAVLVELDRVAPDLLEELVVEAWLSRAPKRVAAAWLEARGGGDAS